MDGCLNPSRPVAQNQSLQRNLAPAVTRHKNICIATMAKNNPNYSAKSAVQTFNPTIVLKDHLRRNTSAPTVSVLYSAGKHACMSLFTSAATITARTALTLSKNSTRRNGHCLKPNLRNLNSVTFTANIYSKSKSCNIPRRSNRSSILQRSITLQTSLA